MSVQQRYQQAGNKARQVMIERMFSGHQPNRSILSLQMSSPAVQAGQTQHIFDEQGDMVIARCEFAYCEDNTWCGP